jgi:ATP-dependent protease HslVU (ClpYQ) peptidase subunit
MYTWREVFEYDRFWAIGSGSSYALGAMYTVYDRLSTAEEIAEVRVSASCEFDDGTGLPFTIHSTKLLKPGGSNAKSNKALKRTRK